MGSEVICSAKALKVCVLHSSFHLQLSPGGATCQNASQACCPSLLCHFLSVHQNASGVLGCDKLYCADIETFLITMPGMVAGGTVHRWVDDKPKF